VKRRLIVNADDFGLNPAVNRGVARAHEEGIVTSASLMVRASAAEDAVDYAKANRRLSLGLHADLAEWVYSDGEWKALYERAAPDDARAIAAELETQLELFEQLVGRPPTHIDAHQHVHRQRPAARVFKALASRLAVPLRGYSPDVAYSGAFYGMTEHGDPYPEGISLDSLIAAVRALPHGLTELGCHPAEEDEELAETWYGVQRADELRTLCDPRVREVLADADVELTSFGALGRS
jgi:chitin disaccharide deacetylase